MRLGGLGKLKNPATSLSTLNETDISVGIIATVRDG
jgi:hypothetical protein